MPVLSARHRDSVICVMGHLCPVDSDGVVLDLTDDEAAYLLTVPGYSEIAPVDASSAPLAPAVEVDAPEVIPETESALEPVSAPEAVPVPRTVAPPAPAKRPYHKKARR